MDQTQPLNARAVLLILLTVVLWAATPVAIRYSTDLLRPMTVSGLRFLLAGIFMLGWVRVHKTSLRLRAGQWKLPCIGGILLFFQIGTFTAGVDLSNASHGSIFVNTFIFWIVAIEHFVTRVHRITPLRFTGLFLAAFGVTLILFPDSDQPVDLLERASLEGDLLLLLSAFILAVKLTYTKYAVRNLHPDSFIFWHGVFGTSLMLGWAFLFEDFRPGVLMQFEDLRTQHAVWSLLYQGFAVAGLCFAIQARLLEKHSASSVAVFSFATPLFGILFAVLFRGDPLSPWLFVSGIAVATGILLVNLRLTPQPLTHRR
ncbi:MAG: DMT family transporter [Fuerstiella sp.]|nr:DMT family transporter [Fuerstiella sp.]